MAHRNINLENAIINPSTGDATLINFGLPRKDTSGQKFTETLDPTSAPFTAPEILDGRFSQKCDMWAIGVLCYRLVGGDFPFKGKNMSELCYEIHKREPSFEVGEWSSSVKHLI